MRLGHRWTGVAVSSRRATDADFAALAEAFEVVHEVGGVLVCNKCALTDRLARGVPRMFCRDGKQIAEWCDVLVALVASDRTGGTEYVVRECEVMGKEIILV